MYLSLFFGLLRAICKLFFTSQPCWLKNVKICVSPLTIKKCSNGWAFFSWFVKQKRALFENVTCLTGEFHSIFNFLFWKHALKLCLSRIFEQNEILIQIFQWEFSQIENKPSLQFTIGHWSKALITQLLPSSSITFGFLMFSRGIKRDNWHKMG